MPQVMRRCSKCQSLSPRDDFYRHKGYKDGIMRWCRKCQIRACKEGNKKQFAKPRYRLWFSSKGRSNIKGIEHSLRMSDIELPETCKYLGIKLDYRRASERGTLRAFNAPSIDRIDSSRGYVPGNVQVISDLANRMKQNATIEQLLAFAEGVLRVHGED